MGMYQHNMPGQGQFNPQIPQHPFNGHPSNSNLPGFFNQSHPPQNQCCQNYSFPEPAHSPQNFTPQNAQFGSQQPRQGGFSPSFGLPPPCPHVCQNCNHPIQPGSQRTHSPPQPPIQIFSPAHSPHHPFQVAHSQEQAMYQQYLDQHNFQVRQQQHDISPHNVHPMPPQDIRGDPIRDFVPPQHHSVIAGRYQEPHLFYYNLSYQIPQSHSFGIAPDFQRFKHPVAEWDMGSRHQQQFQGEYKGKPRKADQGREVKDDRENDRTKESFKDSDKRSENKEQERPQKNQLSKRAEADLNNPTTSEDEHDDEHRRKINPRSFDTKYPENAGPYMPYHAYPPGVHLPYRATHLGHVPILPSPHQFSPIPLPTPPNTPLHYLQPSPVHFPHHMPHVPMPDPYGMYPDFLGPAFPTHDDYYDDRGRAKRRRRDKKREPSPERMNEEKGQADKKNE